MAKALGLITPTRPELPKVKNEAWAHNPIDRFILARLEREGLSPSPEAAKTTLIRRLSFDLTGLPPTPEEADAFLTDQSANAYEKVVDRLLASPRVWRADGLRMARGRSLCRHQRLPERRRTRHVALRDWVIEAYNRNLPFDQFTIEQIAGDLLPKATLEQESPPASTATIAATPKGASFPRNTRVEYVVDRVETTSTVWLGLTLGCARCHEHKFDPFTQKGVLPAVRLLQQHPGEGTGHQAGQLAALYQGAEAPSRKRKLDRLNEAMLKKILDLTFMEKPAHLYAGLLKDIPAHFDWADESNRSCI